MLEKIKNRIEKELAGFINEIKNNHDFCSASPLLFNTIKDFILSNGKRARPVLYSIAYLGFTKKAAPGLYRSALAFELLHDYMLIHDDIIDKSDTRRGEPAVHVKFNRHLRGIKNIKFSGQDLGMLAGDIIYALAIKAFLSIKENPERKEKALNSFIDAALYTGSGEFIELISSITGIEKTTKTDIYKIYDYKTAVYTFASPLSAGALLAGTKQSQANKLFDCGISLGRAFQIKDDILGTFSAKGAIGKSNLTDLIEGKKTLLVLQAYQNSSNKDKKTIKTLLSKKDANQADLVTMRKIIIQSGALDYAKKEVLRLREKSTAIITSSQISGYYKKELCDYIQNLLAI